MSDSAFDFGSYLTWIRLGIALVWLIFGLVFKALGALRRHKEIVARVVGVQRSRTVTNLVAGLEIALAAWMLSGRWLVVCVGVQTLAIVTMNALELRYARDLLVSPLGMVFANAVLLALGWHVALAH